MKDFKRYILLAITVFICAVLVAVFWFFNQKSTNSQPMTDQFVQDKAALERLIQNSSEIHRIWNEGEDSREWNIVKSDCLKHFKITTPFDESLLRCNPIVLQCNQLFNSKINYRFVTPEGDDSSNPKVYRYLTKSNSSHLGMSAPGFLFTIEDKISRKHLNIFLNDQCHEIFLPNRIFAYGEEIVSKPNEEIEDYRFDNFNQNIYIDRHLVMNSEINDWIDFGNPSFTKGLKKKEEDELFLPATQLTYSQMENFCSFKEKQVMLAHYFDAASFMPMDMDNSTPKDNKRSPYYWSKKKTDFKPDCSLIYAEECAAKKTFRLNSTSPSWAGVMDSMGGVFEAFRNPIDPESNLKASSYYFNFKSPWHKLGFRAGWDGEGFELRHFDFKGINPSTAIDKFNVGFRCMRESR